MANYISVTGFTPHQYTKNTDTAFLSTTELLEVAVWNFLGSPECKAMSLCTRLHLFSNVDQNLLNE